MCIVGWIGRVHSGGGTLRCGYSPDSPKMWPARLVTASDGNNRFRNRTLGRQTVSDNTAFDSDTFQRAFRPIEKGHFHRCRPEIWCTDAVQLCQSLIVQQLHTVGASFFLHLEQPYKVIVPSIADTSVILRTISFRRSQSLSRLTIWLTNDNTRNSLPLVTFIVK